MHDNLSFKSEKIKLERNKSLEGLTLFKSRGTAEYYAEPENVRGLRDALLIAKDLGLRITVIGSGTHVILPDHGIDGLLISTKNLKGITIKGSLITCMAGESLNNVINSAIEHNLMGLEEFGGIPGTIAAAMRINARAQGKHISSYHFYTDTMSYDGKIHRKPDYLDFFNSRRTILDEDEILLSTTLRLREGKRTAEARIRKEGQRIQDSIAEQFPRPWLNAVDNGAMLAACMKTAGEQPLYINGWRLRETICGPKSVTVRYEHRPGASYVNLPEFLTLTGDGTDTAERKIPIAPEKRREQAALPTLSFVKRSYRLRVRDSWKAPASKVVKKTEITAPWQAGRFELHNVPPACLLSGEIGARLELPGCIVESVVMETGKNATIKGVVHAYP